MADALDRLRQICLAFPEVTERPSHGAPTWFVRDKKVFVTFWQHGHHDEDLPPPVVCGPAGRPGGIAAGGARPGLPAPVRRPPGLARGPAGRRVDWDEIAEWCEDAYRVVAPRSLVARLDR